MSNEAEHAPVIIPKEGNFLSSYCPTYNLLRQKHDWPISLCSVCETVTVLGPMKQWIMLSLADMVALLCSTNVRSLTPALLVGVGPRGTFRTGIELFHFNTSLFRR